AQQFAQDGWPSERMTHRHICHHFKILYDRFLTLEYTLGEPLGAIQFGFTLLEFTPDGQALRGGFVGYGALVTRGVVTGTVCLQRQEAYETQSEAVEE
ncbi:MAG TPA: hypothetical protein VFV38_41320, partial [Ktedonobacteraceae bacterium]|nr:hypothetical protein [Ktedonobacteraceae bacterium]